VVFLLRPVLTLDGDAPSIKVNMGLFFSRMNETKTRRDMYLDLERCISVPLNCQESDALSQLLASWVQRSLTHASSPPNENQVPDHQLISTTAKESKP